MEPTEKKCHRPRCLNQWSMKGPLRWDFLSEERKEKREPGISSQDFPFSAPFSGLQKKIKRASRGWGEWMGYKQEIKRVHIRCLYRDQENNTTNGWYYAQELCEWAGHRGDMQNILIRQTSLEVKGDSGWGMSFHGWLEGGSFRKTDGSRFRTLEKIASKERRKKSFESNFLSTGFRSLRSFILLPSREWGSAISASSVQQWELGGEWRPIKVFIRPRGTREAVGEWNSKLRKQSRLSRRLKEAFVSPFAET